MSVNIRGMRRAPFVVTAFGLNYSSAAGASNGVPIAGVAVGDVIENVRLATTGASVASSFETKATVAGEIQQSSATDLSANEYDFIISAQS